MRIDIWIITIAILTIIGYSLFSTKISNQPLQSAPSACMQPNRDALQSLAVGDLAALKILDTPRVLPDFEFMTTNNRQIKLSDFKGKAVVMNFWATWCLPCREEMPTLDNLQTSLDQKAAEVVAVSLDLGSIDKPIEFYKSINLNNLKVYHDPKAKLLQNLKKIGRGSGLPTTLLIDPNGCEQAFLLGPANWSSATQLLQLISHSPSL